MQKKGKRYESFDTKYNIKNKKNIEIENYKFRINWIKNYIKKDIAEYFNNLKKEYCRQEEAKTCASTEDGEIEYLTHSS